MVNFNNMKMIQKTIFLGIVFTMSLFSLYSQNPAIEWQKCFGGSFADYGLNILLTSGNGYIIAGETQSIDYDAIGNHTTSEGESDAFVVKLSANYSTEWIKCYGGSNSDNINSVLEISNQCFLLSGTTGSNDGDVTNNHGGTDGWIVKSDSSGEIIWQKCYGGTGSSDVIFKTIQINDGSFICAGYSNSNDGDVMNPEMEIKGWIFKIDSLGIIEWSRCYGDTIKSKFYDIIPTNDGGYFITGKKYLNGFNVANIWLLKISEVGNIEWEIDYGCYYEEIYSIKQLSDGSYIGVGQTYDTLSHLYIGLILNISESGVIEWTLHGTNYNGKYTSVEVISDSSFMVGGYGENNANNSADFLLLKMSNSGNIIWEQYYGGIHREELYSFKQTIDQGYILTGITSSEWTGYHGDYDVWIVKLSPETGISDNNQILNFQIYPSPTQDILTVKVDPALINQPYQIFSITGQLVLSGILTYETSQINLNSILEGIYLLQVGTQTKKFVKIH